MSLAARILGWYAAGHRGTARDLAKVTGEALWDVRIALSHAFVKGEVALIDYDERNVHEPIFAALGTPAVRGRSRPVRDADEPAGAARPPEAARPQQAAGRPSQGQLFD